MPSPHLQRVTQWALSHNGTIRLPPRFWDKPFVDRYYIKVNIALGETFPNLLPIRFAISDVNRLFGFQRSHRAPCRGMTWPSAFPDGVVQNLLQAIIRARRLANRSPRA